MRARGGTIRQWRNCSPPLPGEAFVEGVYIASHCRSVRTSPPLPGEAFVEGSLEVPIKAAPDALASPSWGGLR